jgi:hypothetical protein
MEQIVALQDKVAELQGRLEFRTRQRDECMAARAESMAAQAELEARLEDCEEELAVKDSRIKRFKALLARAKARGFHPGELRQALAWLPASTRALLRTIAPSSATIHPCACMRPMFSHRPCRLSHHAEDVTIACPAASSGGASPAEA